MVIKQQNGHSEQLLLAQLHWLIADEYDEMNMINNFNCFLSKTDP